MIEESRIFVDAVAEEAGLDFADTVAWLLWTVVFGLVDWHLNLTQLFWPLSLGLSLGLIFALRNGGWFVLLQKIAQLRLARAGNLPPNPYAFLEWGVEQQIFRRVGGGVRFRHNLIQQHLAKDSEDTNQS